VAGFVFEFACPSHRKKLLDVFVSFQAPWAGPLIPHNQHTRIQPPQEHEETAEGRAGESGDRGQLQGGDSGVNLRICGPGPGGRPVSILDGLRMSSTVWFGWRKDWISWHADCWTGLPLTITTEQGSTRDKMLLMQMRGEFCT